MLSVNNSDNIMNDYDASSGGGWVCQLQVVETVLGILGNILVCFVILRVKFLHNMTNYLLVNLAVADMLLCLVVFFTCLAADVENRLIRYVPETLVGRELLCRVIVSNYLCWVLIYVSSYSLCIVSLERYVAIMHPLKYVTSFTPRRVTTLLALIWILPFIIALPCIFINGGSQEPNMACSGLSYPFWSFPVLFGIYTFLSGYVLPIALMAKGYYEIQKTLKRQAKALNLQQARAAASDLLIARKRVVSMLTIVLGALVILWTPGYLVTLVCPQPTQDPTVSFAMCSSQTYKNIRGFTDFLFYFNSVINPFIYEFKYKRFRQGFKVAFCGCLGKRADNRVHVQMVPM